MIFDDEGGRGVSQKVIFDDEGGRGVQTPHKKDDIIYEQPLISFTNTFPNSCKCGSCIQTFTVFSVFPEAPAQLAVAHWICKSFLDTGSQSDSE